VRFEPFHRWRFSRFGFLRFASSDSRGSDRSGDRFAVAGLRTMEPGEPFEPNLANRSNRTSRTVRTEPEEPPNLANPPNPLIS